MLSHKRLEVTGVGKRVQNFELIFFGLVLRLAHLLDKVESRRREAVLLHDFDALISLQNHEGEALAVTRVNAGVAIVFQRRLLLAALVLGIVLPVPPRLEPGLKHAFVTPAAAARLADCPKLMV